jgi:hypothetical protein
MGFRVLLSAARSLGWRIVHASPEERALPHTLDCGKSCDTITVHFANRGHVILDIDHQESGDGTSSPKARRRIFETPIRGNRKDASRLTRRARL